MKKIILLLGFIALSTAIWAEETDTVRTMKEYYMSTVTVTGTRTPKSLDTTPVPTHIITADDIKKIDATNIKDVLLSEIPGIEFSFAMNQQVSMRMQGLGGMAVLFLIDGERMAGETLDNIDFSRLNVDNIERIEIVKGAASALYGSNSVGAVVNIITKINSEPWTLQINSRHGSRYGKQLCGSTFSVKQGKFSNIFNLQFDKQDSYVVYDEEQNLYDKLIQLSTTVYGTRHWNFKDKLIFQLNDKHQLIGKAGYYFYERNSSPEQKDRARDFNGGLRYIGQITKKGTLDVGYSADRYDKSDFYPLIDKDFLDYKNIQHCFRALYSQQLNDNVVITAGGDLMSDYLKSYQFKADEDHHSQVTADIFGQYDWTINSHWNVLAGLRADYFSRYGWELTPKLAAMYKISDFNFRGSYSKGFRAPTLKEMYMDFNMANIFNIYGNDKLKSEQSNSFSLSAEYMKKYYYVAITGHYNIIDNKISTIWNPSLAEGRGAVRYENVGGTNLASIDAEIMARYPSGINAKISYSYFHEFTRNGALNTADTRPHSVIAQVDYLKTWKNYQINAIINGRFLSKATFHTYVNGQYEQLEEMTSEAYTVWKLTLLQKFFDCFTITTSIDNLFNYKPKRYEYNSLYTLGTSVNIGLVLEIDKFVKLF